MTTTKSQPKAPANSQPFDLAAASLPLAVGRAAVQAWMDLGTEAVRFVWDRLQQDAQTQQAMLACKSLEELQAIQAEFFAAAQQQYAAEAGKMLGLLGRTTVEGLSASGPKRHFDDVPL